MDCGCVAEPPTQKPRAADQFCSTSAPAAWTAKDKKLLDKPASLCYNNQAFRECTPYRGVEQLEARRAHNPEVVGSSPASATIKTPNFDKKSGVFLTFYAALENLKMPWGLFWGLFEDVLFRYFFPFPWVLLANTPARTFAALA